jgi:hypothetical protein
METIEVKKSCGICAHYPNILIHCSVGNKAATKGTSACDKFILHDSYKPPQYKMFWKNKESDEISQSDDSYPKHIAEKLTTLNKENCLDFEHWIEEV